MQYSMPCGDPNPNIGTTEIKVLVFVFPLMIIHNVFHYCGNMWKQHLLVSLVLENLFPSTDVTCAHTIKSRIVGVAVSVVFSGSCHLDGNKGEQRPRWKNSSQILPALSLQSSVPPSWSAHPVCMNTFIMERYVTSEGGINISQSHFGGVM